tara:strand:- start:52 stop:468 length:417 start_codon:yes stop_codon:yes gene_type:complete
MSIKNRIEKINEMFEIFDNPMDKYTQIIEFGKKNSGLENKNKTDENRIFGCASLAWIKTYSNNKTYSIKTDSDTFIVKGLLNILEFIINDSSKDEIINLKIQHILENIGLEKSITSQRTNGFLSALEKIKKQIENYEQ